MSRVVSGLRLGRRARKAPTGQDPQRFVAKKGGEGTAGGGAKRKHRKK